MKKLDKTNCYEVVAAGVRNQLIVDVGCHCGGDVRDGVGFEIDDRGWLAVPIEELEEIVRVAREYRKKAFDTQLGDARENGYNAGYDAGYYAGQQDAQS